MRINKYLSLCKIASRRKSEDLIVAGRVKIDGRIAKLSDKVDVENSQVTLDGNEIRPNLFVYYAFYKPVGVICSTVKQSSSDKIIDDYLPDNGLIICGRLDKESEGLVVLTNDGEFANDIMHPSNDHEKEYLVEVKTKDKIPSDSFTDAIKLFKCGCKIDGKKTAPASINILAQSGPRARFRIILKQGLNRQIRKTFGKCRLEVLSLKRVRINDIGLENLRSGEYKQIQKVQKVDKSK
jgi:pseudouridine synthase